MIGAIAGDIIGSVYEFDKYKDNGFSVIYQEKQLYGRHDYDGRRDWLAIVWRESRASYASLWQGVSVSDGG